MKENPENHKLSLGDRQSKIVKKKQAFPRCLFFNYRNKSIKRYEFTQCSLNYWENNDKIFLQIKS